MAAATDSDYETSSSWALSSIAASRRTSTSSSAPSLSHGHFKPHKANQTAWEAVSRIRGACATGRLGLEHFRLVRRLGGGDIGNVYLCHIRNLAVGLRPACFYAMKVVDREALAVRKKLQRAEMEREILGMLDHPFVPTLYADFEASHYSCLVMEYCPGGDLFAARLRQPGKRFTVSAAKFYAAEVLLALEYLHMMGIIYRDLKPENVLVREDGHIMLSDFDLSFKCDVVPKLLRLQRPPATNPEDDEDHLHGQKCSTPSCSTTPILKPVLSCFSLKKTKRSTTTTTNTTTIIRENVNQDQDQGRDGNDPGDDDGDDRRVVVAEPVNARSKSFVGTHEYLAPEVISGQGHGSAVDWWTLGVFLYEMVFGMTPFKGENNEKTLVNILKKPLTFPRVEVKGGREYEEMVRLQDLISKLLVRNPKKRIGGLKGSADIKRHEFFRGVNWALIRSVKPPWIPSDPNNHNRDSCLRTRLMSKKERDEPFQISNYDQQQHHGKHHRRHCHHHLLRHYHHRRRHQHQQHDHFEFF